MFYVYEVNIHYQHNWFRQTNYVKLVATQETH